MNLTHALFPPLLILMPVGAEAGLEFCNNSDEKVSVAIGYNDGGVWTSEGWWVAEPDECIDVIKGDLTQRYYYILVDAADFDGVYDKSANTYNFCVANEAFTISGDEDCEARGYTTRDFNEVDTGDNVRYGIDLQPY